MGAVGDAWPLALCEATETASGTFLSCGALEGEASLEKTPETGGEGGILPTPGRRTSVG